MPYKMKNNNNIGMIHLPKKPEDTGGLILEQYFIYFDGGEPQPHKESQYPTNYAASVHTKK